MGALGALGINLGLLAANLLNVLLMILLLTVVAYRPIVKMLRTRRERIAEGLNNARRAEEALASAEADKQAILDQARAEAQRIAAEARARAEEAANQIKAEARAEANRILQEAREDAAAERAQLLAEMREQIVDLSIAAANRLIGASLDEKRQRAIITEFFTAVPEEAKTLSGALTVITAIPLTEAEQKKFKTALGTETITFEVDPAILGGVIVRGGGREVNASFANQLAELRAALM